jgi:hypothetical protein
MSKKTDQNLTNEVNGRIDPEDSSETAEQGVVSSWARKAQEGKIGYIILWLLGVPVSLLLLIFLIRGCT